jgi:hypothetical protein
VLALGLPQSRQARGGAEFQGFSLLVAGDIEGLVETGFGFSVKVLSSLSWAMDNSCSAN